MKGPVPVGDGAVVGAFGAEGVLEEVQVVTVPGEEEAVVVDVRGVVDVCSARSSMDQCMEDKRMGHTLQSRRTDPGLRGIDYSGESREQTVDRTAHRCSLVVRCLSKSSYSINTDPLLMASHTILVEFAH